MMLISQAKKIAPVLIVVLTLLPIFSLAETCEKPSENKNGTSAGWSDDINLSNDPAYRDVLPRIAVSGNNIHVVWLHNYQDVFYSNSVTGGMNWSVPKNLFHSSLSVDWPVISVNSNLVHVVWSYWNSTSGKHEVLYRNSTDNGVTWNNIKRISDVTGFNARWPEMFINGANLHIIWQDARDGPNIETYYRRSIDDGGSFDNGQGVNQDRRISFSPSTVTGSKIAGNGNNISIAWMDERNGDFEIYWTISKNNGNTWEDGLGHVGIDRRLTFTGVYDYTIGVDSSNIHIAWIKQQWPGPTYSLYYCNSNDNGVTWNSPQLLSGPVSAMDWPDIDVDRVNVSIVWQDKRDDGTHEQIYLKNSTNGGVIWNPDIRLTYNLTRGSASPKINMINGTTHLVRVDGYSGDTEIYYKRYPDFPDISPPSHSNETPPPHSYKDPPGTTISVRVIDPSGVNASSIMFYVNGSLVTHSLTPITDGYNVSYVSPGLHSGTISCRIVANDTLGNHLDYTWSFTVLNSFKIPVVAGWNLISLPLVQPNSNLPIALLDRDNNTFWDRAMSYNASYLSDHWRQFDSNWPPSLNDLNGVNNRMGLWLNVTNVGGGFLNVSGMLPTLTQIPLHAGWNLVGYPSVRSNMTVANAFWGTGADIVEAFNPSATYKTRVVGPAYIMKPGEGYWVHVSVDTIWPVNW